MPMGIELTCFSIQRMEVMEKDFPCALVPQAIPSDIHEGWVELMVTLSFNLSGWEAS